MSKMVNVEAVRSDGLRFSYNKNDWKMLTLEGVDFPEIEVFSEARGFGHGDIVTGIRTVSYTHLTLPTIYSV